VLRSGSTSAGFLIVQVEDKAAELVRAAEALYVPGG